MASVNKVILVGNLGANPETRYMPSGDAVCNFSVATTEVWKDKASGERREATEWHRVALFGRTAEVASEYLRKGSQVYIEGRLQTRKWKDKDGQDRYTTEIRGDDMKMLGGRQSSQGGEPAGAGAGAPSTGNESRESAYSAAPARPPYQTGTAAGSSGTTTAPQRGGGGGGGSGSGFGDFDDDIPFTQHGNGRSWQVI